MKTDDKPTSPKTNYVLGTLIMFQKMQAHTEVVNEQNINDVL
jgi:hypothetical protein